MNPSIDIIVSTIIVISLIHNFWSENKTNIIPKIAIAIEKKSIK